MNVKECDVKVIYRRLFCDCGLEMVRDKTLQTHRGFEYTYIYVTNAMLLLLTAGISRLLNLLIVMVMR